MIKIRVSGVLGLSSGYAETLRDISDVQEFAC